MSGETEPEASSEIARDANAELPPNFFRTVIQTANEGIWMIDCEGKTTFANDRMAGMLGVTYADMIGKHPRDYLVPEDMAKAAEVIRLTLSGQPQEFEPRFVRADGSHIPTLGGTAPIHDQEGAIIGAVATFSDLTANKAAEQALMASERDAKANSALLDHLLSSATDAIWMRDVAGIFRVANPAARAVMGNDKGNVIGQSVDEIWGPEVGRQLMNEAERIYALGHGITVEEEMFDAGNGRMTTFLSNKVPLFAEDGTPEGILGVSRDITQRKRVEDDLRRSQAQLAEQVAELEALYGSAPIGLGFFSRDYRYLRINDELAAINGVPAAEHLGRTVREVVPVNAPYVEPVIDQIFATGKAVRDLEIKGETPQQPGVERHWLTGFYPVHAADGSVQAVGAWVVEISERKAAEQRELLLAREVDHRAKNLLAVVQSIVQLTPTTDPAEFKESVIGRIQALAKAHSLLSDARWDGVDLGQLIQEELAPYANTSSMRVRCTGPSITLKPAAAQSLALVFHELATNAAKYGSLQSSRGEVEVTWDRISEASGSYIQVKWVEHGGPSVSQPDTLGFGSSIIRTSVERQLRGQVTKTWSPGGLECLLRIPAVEVALGADG